MTLMPSMCSKLWSERIFHGSPTNRQIEAGVAICYTIENNKIVSHRMIADMAAPMEQFGISNLETHKASFTKSE